MLGKYVRVAGLYTVVGLILFAFVVFYGGAQGMGREYVARVRGEEIPLEVFRIYRTAESPEEQRLRDMGLKSSDVTRFVDRKVMDYLIQQTLLSQRAEEMGFLVGDEELRRAICANPAVRGEDGRCDPVRVERLREGQGFSSERSYVDTLRRELLVQKMATFLEQSVRVSDDAARDQLRRERTSLRLDYAALRAADFAKDVQVSDDEAKAFQTAQAARIQQEYERRTSEFKRPEQLRIRHILLTGDDAEPAAGKAKARLDKGEDFAKVAKDVSKDPISAAAGGDLGLLSKDQMLPEFAAAAFGAELNKIVGPVKTERGQHLLRIEEKKPALDLSLEQASPQLARELLTTDRARERARAQAEKLSTAVAAGKPLGEAAKELGIEVKQTPEFNPQVRIIPDLEPAAGLRETAIGLRMDKPSSARIFGEGDSFYLIALAQRSEPDLASLAGEVEGMRTRLEFQMRGQLASELYRKLREEADAAGEIEVRGLEGV
jgi:peptidyl-prolyl cis-trans isomerase D